jgi:hypothetical protein
MKQYLMDLKDEKKTEKKKYIRPPTLLQDSKSALCLAASQQVQDTVLPPVDSPRNK